MKFVASGNLRIGGRTEKFSRDVVADDESAARERIYSLFGSEHGTKRRWIKIEKVEKSGQSGE